MHALLGRLLLTWLVMMAVGSASAVEVDGLYQVSRKVADRGDAPRMQAFRQGLAEALVRVNGHTAVLALPEINRALEKPSSYIQGFSYRTQKIQQQLETSSGTNLSQIVSPIIDNQVAQVQPLVNEIEQLWLDIQYDRKKMQRLLVAQGQPVWGSRRPSLLFWTAVDLNGRRQFVSGEQSFGDQLRKSMLDAATERGLPLVFPLYDLQDRSKLTVSDFWGGFYQNLDSASTRYDADFIVTLRGAESAGRWSWRWQLLKEGRVLKQWTVEQTPQPAMAQGVSLITEYLADLYAIKQDLQPHQYQVLLTGLDSAEQFAQAEVYLASLGQVERVELLQLSNQGARISVTLLQIWPDFLRSLKLDQLLVAPVNPQELPAVPNDDKILQWTL
ncbi:DUF2066 domain-containing protein [Pelagibaculum spongiae]|uniref:DUF2066 domain-containing protein n=1 Tax=Pelagibaculum spongiae TaxID=2080658 RepID=A0A2V1GP37_9GAMM|nr:DUF2066 domain-containing protein [Pelagibaculum spongiae]PVZ64335.1 hypothetical protein DC094_19925 [Pelagibaculum spongiae]